MLAFSAALVVPYFVDWSQYRAQFEAEATKILGRRVTVEGEATARLFPFPSVRFTHVTVAGRDGSAKPAVTMDAFSMDAELAPFLSGEILIFDMRMEKPVATVAVGADGAIDWAIRPNTPFDPSQVHLENIKVVDGTVHLEMEGPGRNHEFTGLSLNVSAKSLEGPWHVAGTGLFDGYGAEVTVATGKADAAGSMRMRATITPQALGARLETDGVVRLENAAPRYDGTLSLATLAQKDEKGKGPGEGDRLRVNGRFSADHKRIAVDEYRFETGRAEKTYAATGTALIDLGATPSFAVQARGDQLSFDTPETEYGTAPRSLQARFGELAAFLGALPPFLIQGTVDVDLPAIVAANTTLRSVMVSARPDAGQWQVDAFSAELPGRTVVEGSGKLTTGENAAFEGDVVVASRQLSGLASWISDSVDERLRAIGSAGASAKVSLTEEEQSFRDLELIAGDTKLIGMIARLAPQDLTPSISVRLTGETVDADALQALATMALGKIGGGITATHDIDVSLKAELLKFRGIEADEFDTALRLRGTRLEIDKLSASDIAGAAVSATATLDNPFTAPSGKADLSVIAEDLTPLLGALQGKGAAIAGLSYLRQRAETYGGLFADSEINTIVSFDFSDPAASDVTASISGVSGGTDVSATMTQATQAGGPAGGTIDAQISLSNPNASPVMALLGVEALPIDLGAALAAELTLSGSLARGLDVKALMSGDGGEAAITGRAREENGNVRAEGTVSVRSGDVEPYLVTAGVALPGLGSGLPVDLKASFAGTEQDFTLADIGGKLAESTVSGNLKVAVDSDPASPSKGRQIVAGALELSDADLMLATEAVLGTNATLAVSPDGDAELFAQSATVPIAGTVAIKAKNVEAGPFGAAADAAFDLVLAQDGAELSNFSGTFRGAALTGRLALKNNGGSALLTASGRWNGVDLARLLGSESGAALLSGSADIGGNLTATGRSAEGLIAGLSGSGAAELKGLTIAGPNEGALPGILAAADPLAVSLTDEKARAIALDEMSKGGLSAGDISSAFTVAGGVLRLPPLTIETGQARLTAGIKHDFATGSAAVEGEVEYKPGPDDVLTGAQPRVSFTLEGPPGAMTAAYATEPMVQYLTQRALEREQARVEIMQAVLMEKQRMRREMRLMAALQDERARLDETDRMAKIEAQRFAEELAAIAAAEEEKRRAEEQKRKLEEEKRLKAEAEAAAKEAMRKAAEEEAARKAAEAAARKAAAEAERKAAEEEKKRRAEEARRLKEEEEARAARERQAQEAAATAQPERLAPIIEPNRIPQPPALGDLRLLIPEVQDAPVTNF